MLIISVAQHAEITQFISGYPLSRKPMISSWATCAGPERFDEVYQLAADMGGALT
jgi:hypothetical protein